ncbi:hypothetical protein P7D22_03335 [Lichenihabitans sp. Uapishka_5]|uniref:hypothetical protein n=1 Tax=Lichenihabitans sp. Uapishka_5 TaxID=3037302 RepID=UPI0029E7EE41|nr:hypothetical protein [Lichenihabitans sp. Uapishka_5]MDX7950211.1 hypothetical protein [Lichenihabitans sp. Uapishka_5]
MRLTAVLVAVLAVAQSRSVEAAEMVTTPELRQAAVAACTGDVLRLCPTVMFDEQQVFACMRTNRNQLTPGCRSVFDKGAKTVRQ